MSSKIRRRCIYIDLSNVYGGICNVFEPGIYIDFSTIIPILDKYFGGINQFKVYSAYMGELQIKKHGYERVKAQNEFISSARVDGVYFGKGHISNDQKEKGVDMRIGVDMVNDAHNDTYDDFILFSGDADFQYPVDIIKGMGKKFHYCGFVHRYHPYFAWQADRILILDYNGIFANHQTTLDKRRQIPRNAKIIDIYKDKNVKTKSVIT